MTLIEDMLRVMRLPLRANQRRVARAHVADLIDV
jgi:hypothetical protein